ncbi:L-lysine 6-transaminase [bacterium]|nr:L-lysine 6-transaminase [bacterium]
MKDPGIEPQKVHETLNSYMLADGFELVVDLKKSQGMYIFDSRQKKWYLDFFSCFASLPIGFNHPKMMVPEFLEKLAYVSVNKPSNSDIYTKEMADFVATFARIAKPPEFKHLFFISGGALAVENALKTAFDWKIRKNMARGMKGEVGTSVIHFQESFHGRSGYTLSLTNTADPRKTMYFPKFDWPRVVNPKIAFPLNEENLRRVEELEQQSLNQIKEALTRYGDDIAAIIIEPIQAEGGDHHFRPEFLQSLRTIADESELMLIYDEIQTGMGLTGTLWAYEQLSPPPDILAFGKKSQICGIMATDRVDEIEDNVFKISSRLNSTWGGNLIDMVRCQKYLEIMEEENLIENARAMGEYLFENLLEVQQEFPGSVFNARGRGLMVAFDMADDQIRTKFLDEIYTRELILIKCGFNSIRFRPSLTVKKEDIDKAFVIIREALRAIS